MGFHRPLLQHKVGPGLVLNLLPRPPQPQEESGPVRIEKAQMKNLPRPPLLHKKGIPARIGMDSFTRVPEPGCQVPF